MNHPFPISHNVTPACPVFGECGGCQFQDISYDAELRQKEEGLRQLFAEAGLTVDCFEPIVASPREYHYRSRLDLKFLKIKSGKMFMGFTPVEGFQVVEVNDCPIAMEALARFLPRLKDEAVQKIPAKYRNANLTVKTGDDGRVFWGGIGRRSLRLSPDEYLWTEIDGKRIFYSLETFFQANLSILPRLTAGIRSLGLFGQDKIFFDLYGGVGLFGIVFCGEVGKVVLVEENIHAVACARHNIAFNHIENMQLVEGRMETAGPELFNKFDAPEAVLMVDPPRAGLSDEVVTLLGRTKHLANLLYLSCHPESLIRDLKVLTAQGWRIARVMPFDFFPKTRHVETLVVLSKENGER